MDHNQILLSLYQSYFYHLSINSSVSCNTPWMSKPENQWTVSICWAIHCPGIPEEKARIDGTQDTFLDPISHKGGSRYLFQSYRFFNIFYFVRVNSPPSRLINIPSHFNHNDITKCSRFYIFFAA